MYECQSCSDSFYWEDDCEEHMDDYGHWPECETCPKTFRTWAACNQHMNALDHWAPTFECETCSREFRSWNAAAQHMNALGHWEPEYECETCGKQFHSQRAADQHMAALFHYRTYCPSCDRHFMSENNLRMHLNSNRHRGSSVTCPFCKAGYTTASGVTHHLESGSCPRAPSLNRETIHRMVNEKDQNGLITNKQIGWYDENTQYQATDQAFNGQHWECYLCHRWFNTIAGLNQHLNSSAHKQQIYHCPSSRCYKEFTALAGLFNHLESESCGFMRFERVQQKVQQVFRGGKLITFQ